jgi:hypothetical protein
MNQVDDSSTTAIGRETQIDPKQELSETAILLPLPAAEFEKPA